MGRSHGSVKRREPLRFRRGSRWGTPVSRVLCRRKSAMTIYLCAPLLAASSDLPELLPDRRPGHFEKCGVLLGLAPDGACRADSVARTAVSSCLAISPLPALRRAVSFCCAIRRIAAPGRYPASCLAVPGLSSRVFAQAVIRRPRRKVSKNLVYS